MCNKMFSCRSAIVIVSVRNLTLVRKRFPIGCHSESLACQQSAACSCNIKIIIIVSKQCERARFVGMRIGRKFYYLFAFALRLKFTHL